ncbi:MAG: hypothetical protein L0Y58_11350 [Verrucomicrobia subdivision 3 bacterium]|nr:hypothetical protein [Limisphaerales bacterium]
MRERHLLYLFLGLNVALAGAFAVYLFLSTYHQAEVVATSFEPTVKSNAPSRPAPAPAAPRSNVTVAARPVTNAASPAITNFVGAVAKPAFTSRKFAWQDVETDAYRGYIDSLRAVGCPDEKIKTIVLADINELFDKKRVREAVSHDMQWWRPEAANIGVVNILQERGRALEQERQALVEKLLGPEAAESEKSEVLLWSSVQLTGPVLGALPPKVHNEVQELCQRSLERQQAYFWSRVNEGQPMNQVEAAQLREQTRADLRKVLNEEQVEEFVLRYSHNAHRLREELRGFEPTPEEFRKIFRAIDPMEHQLQLEFGGPEAMSEAQRQRFERQRDAAIKEALAPERYQAFLLTKDPIYRQAQMLAMQYGAPPRAIMPIYQMAKVNESKRQQIINDATLTPQQKSEALNAMSQEQQRSIQRIVSEAGARR